jgi:hypothetical protein
LQDHPSQDKENVPPSFRQGPIRKQKFVNRCNLLITGGKWTNEALEEVMDVIENGTTSLRKANMHWNICHYLITCMEKQDLGNLDQQVC